MLDDLAARVVDLVARDTTGAEAEVVVNTTNLALTRFANSAIHQNVAEQTTAVRLRLHLDGRTASGSTTLTGADGLRDLVERTIAAARLCPPDPLWPGLAAPSTTPPGSEVDEETAAAPPAARAARVAAFVAAAGGLETAGFCSTVLWSAAFANSAGQSAWAQTAEAAINGIARVGTADGLSRFATPRLRDLDGAVLGARAAAKARAAVDPVELPPGRYEVVMEPTAVVDLMDLIASYGFNGKVINEQRSFVELGAAQFDDSVSLVDEPLDGGGAALTFDVEGTPKSRLALIDAGVSRAATHDRRTAAQAGASSTGHALAGSPAYGPIAMNLVLVPATGAGPVTEVDGPAADSAVAELVAKVGRGLLVTDSWYTRVLDPRSLVVTGLTRNGVWLIEDGEVTRPVRNMRFTQSYPAALAPGAVLGIGGHAVALPSEWGVMTYRAPALRLASWNYSGNASG